MACLQTLGVITLVFFLLPRFREPGYQLQITNDPRGVIQAPAVALGTLVQAVLADVAAAHPVSVRFGRQSAQPNGNRVRPGERKLRLLARTHRKRFMVPH